MLYGNTFGKTSNSGQSIPIGGSMYMTNRGPFVVFDDKTEWVRQGSAVSYSAKYSKAGKIPGIKVFGKSKLNISGLTYSSLSVNNISKGTHVATNYSGTIVVADSAVNGTANAIYRSTNGGVTWSAVSVALGSGLYPTCVVWAGNRFVLAASSSTVGSVSFFHSTTGSSWTAGTTLTGITGITGARLCADTANNAVTARVGSSGGVCIYKSTSNSTFVASSTGFTGNNALLLAGYNNNLITDVSSTFIRVSTNGGSTWGSAVTLSHGGSSITLDTDSTFAYANGIFMLTAASGVVYYSTDPGTAGSWIPTAFDIAAATSYTTDATAVVGFNTLSKDEFYLGTNAGFISTEDFVSWIPYWVTPQGVVNNTYLPVDSKAGVVLFSNYTANDPATTTPYRQFSSLNTPEYLGTRASFTDNNYEYIRIY